MNQRFNEKIESMKRNNKNDELIIILKNGIDEEIVYNALRSIYNIALNVPKVKTEEGMGGRFGDSDIDIDKAVEPIKRFIDEVIRIEDQKNKKETIYKCFRILSDNYTKTATYEEYKLNSCVIENVYYNLNKIPKKKFEDIKENLINKIQLLG